MTDAFDGFPKGATGFLKELEKNNDRDWFNANKKRYQQDVEGPALALVGALAPRIAKISPHVNVVAKKQGGSIMRIYRDTRFSKDKRPYNEHVSMRFGHSARKEDAPGFYLRVGARDLWLGTGIWQPSTDGCNRIRTHIVENATKWKRVRDAKAFRATFGDLEGESLKRPPKGFDKDHPLVEDLKRKDFVAFATWSASKATSKDLPAEIAKAYGSSKAFVAFLCEALGLPF